MASRIRPEQRELVINLLRAGEPKIKIAEAAGLSLGQVSAIAAHLTMGTYGSPDKATPHGARPATCLPDRREPIPQKTIQNTADTAGALKRQSAVKILLGKDVRDDVEVFWAPTSSETTPNPHMLIIGKSGFGKTYAIAGLTAELARAGVCSVVLDHGQSFSPATVPDDFARFASAKFIDASASGIAINPLQIFPGDVFGPINVAQRIADTFSRVYRRIGIQQHAVLRDAVIALLASVGISVDDRASWTTPPPPFVELATTLNRMRDSGGNGRQKHLDSVASHISTLFVFNTFRPGGIVLNWSDIFSGQPGTYIIQLHGLERSVEQVVTEFLLWNIIGTCEALGPSSLRSFIVLDEAHRLSFESGAPIERLLREGRKFGLGSILASQQPEDFSSVAFANTATKLIFQIADDREKVSGGILGRGHSQSKAEFKTTLASLPRGRAYAITGGYQGIIDVPRFQERVNSSLQLDGSPELLP